MIVDVERNQGDADGTDFQIQPNMCHNDDDGGPENPDVHGVERVESIESSVLLIMDTRKRHDRQIEVRRRQKCARSDLFLFLYNCTCSLRIHSFTCTFCDCRQQP